MKTTPSNTFNLYAFVATLLVAVSLPAATFACDTWVALGNSTRDGSVIMGKNSDRKITEAQPLVYFPEPVTPRAR